MDVPRRARRRRTSSPPGLEDEAARTRGSPTISSTRSSEIHAADVTTPGLAASRGPGATTSARSGASRSSGSINKTRELPRSRRSARGSRPTCPTPLPETVVHGDFRLGNTMVAPRRAGAHPRRARLGDGRDRRPARGRRLPARDLQRARRPAEPARHVAGHRARRASRRRRSSPSATSRAAAATSSRSPGSRALALWKAAVFCEAIYGRYLRGELGAEDERAARFEQGVPYLAEAAAEAISAV